jgi:putative FmdB family regulatory protein
MPIYEYSCACGKLFEVLVMRKSDEEEEVKCPDCSGTQVKRVISGTNRVQGGKEHRRPDKPSWLRR